ncbi:VCBS domain-containing protein [Pseudomonas sp. P9_31]|uniref:beta strand repeat-containing protein n=1 Tax=Pseudomonas sp. P9_31 TaxID=3043448 RepID=UPI002A36EAF6|nr:VCBS domain-containing protein [Pseudomonas sp. P9_31]WPN59446.1 VCBS domain-containing protein [Pseudomonas sp. P9_31]
MATTTTTSGGTVTSFSNTPQAQDDIFTTGVIGTGTATITEDLLGVVYLDVMSNDLGGNAKTLWSLDNATSLSTATKVYAPADLLVQDTSRIEATSTDTSLNGAKIWITSDGKVGYDAATLSTTFKAQLQALAAGGSLTDSFTYAIRLGNGTLSWATAQVQFAGVNDSVTMSLGAQAGTVTEDATTTPSTTDSLSTTGTIAFSDVDLSDTHTASFVAAGGNTTALGNFALAAVAQAANAANGTVNWTYTVNNAAAQYLAQGQTATETYVVTVNDGHGSSTTKSVTITITGTNDQVHITSGVQAGDAKEDSGDYAANGSITFTDADLIDTHSVTVTPGASGYLGSFTTDPLHDSTGTGSGSLGWHFAVDNAALQFLGEGQTLTQTYNVAIGDGTVQTVTITITGTNDQVQITSGVQAGNVEEDSGHYAASGSITFTDVDLIDTHSVSVTPGASGYLGSFTTNPLSDSTGTGSGSLGWNFAVNNTALQFLGEGQTRIQTYNVAIGDGTVQTVTITITGTNDQVQITSGVQAGDAKEDSGDYAANGSITFTDADLIDTHSVTVTPGASGYLGSFTTNPLSDSTGTGSGSLGWNFAVNNTALQFLGEGQTRIQTYNVAIGDGTVQTVTITITGTNDQVQITSGVQAGDAKEDSGDYAASGSITFTDVDLIDTHSVSVTPGASGYLGSFTTNPLSDSTGTGSGSLGWNFAVNNTALQFLGEGQTRIQTYNVAIGDGAVQTVTITITGTNDRPTLTIADSTGAMNEGNGTATLSDSGALSFTDLDSTDTVTVSQTANNDIAWSGGTLNAGMASALVAGFSVDQDSWDYSSSQNLDFLGAGETITFSYAVVATDDSGAANAASATQTVSITIIGSNDAPVLSFATGNDAGNVQEDTGLSVSGQFSSADIDHAATTSWTINGSPTGTYGSIAVDSSGQWTYTLANGSDGVASAVQSLKAGESHNEVFSVQVSDGLGGVDTQQVTVTVTGSNDAPVLSFVTGNDVGAVQEDSTLSVSGQFSSADIDHAATASWSIAGSNTGSYGSIAVDSSGQWTYTLANGSDGVASAVQSLKAGESHDEVFSVQVSDGLGGVDTQLVTVTVTGSNDAPVLSFVSGNEAGAVQEDTTLSVSGQFSSADIDHDATATWSINGSPTGTYGSIAVDSSGQWTYTLANGSDGVASAVQSLKAGESHDEVFSVQVSDGLGGVDTQLVTVTVSGSNDAPVLSFVSGNEAGAVQEDTTLSVSGQFSSADIDHAATATWSIAGSNTGSYGSIAVDSSGQWTYTLANGSDGIASAVQSLKAGESHDEVFSVQVSDGLGGVDTQLVTITVSGSNDAPVLSFATGNDTGAVQEDSSLSVSGQFSSADIDHDATASWSIAGTNTGTYGSIAVDGTGQWTYTLANGSDGVASAVQSLKAGESHDEVFSVQVSDGLGGVDTQLVTITVSGSNDAPVLSFATGNDTGAVQEDSSLSLSVSGQFSSADIDHDATATWSIAGTNTGSYGSIAVDSSGQWTYTLANGSDGVASAVQSLKAGESHDEVFSVQVSDGLGGVDTQLVTVTVTGSNDAPVLSFATGNDVGAVQEDITLSVSGQFSSADIDHDATATWSINGSATGSYGSIAVDSTGQWTYTLANGSDGIASAVQSLKAGESHDEVFSVQVSDGLGSVDTQLVIVTVTGSNDQPTLAIADTTGAMNEGDGAAALSDSGALSFADVDNTDTVTVSQTANGDIAWSGGTLNAAVASTLVAGFSVDQDSWDYSSSQNLDFLGAGETITFSYAVVATDDSGAENAASAAQTITITLTGTNDRPTLTIADTTGTMSEGNGAATLSDSGALSFTDLDSTDVVTVSHTANNDITWSGGTLNAGVASALAAGFSVDQDSWDYSTSQNLDFLGTGETITFSYTVVATDDSGAANAASATQTVSITITGSNDAPVLSFATGNDAGAVQEDSTLSVSGQFSSADVDHDATATWTINGSPTGTYGSIAVDSSGQWTYTLANGSDGIASAVQSLKAGESHDEVFSVQVSDGLGGVDTQLVTVTVSGSNDAPVLSFAPGNDGGAVQEDTTFSVSGQFSSADIDHDATATWSIAGSNTGSYGSIAVDSTGQWTYTLANGSDGIASVVQSLKAGESHDEVFSVQVSDGLGGVDTQLVTVTVSGSNDAPVLSFASGNDVGAVQEDSTLSVSGQFSSADIDHDATATWSINGSPTGSYGSIAVDSSGQWTYTLANGSDGIASAVQSLKAGESHDEVFSVQVSDGLGGVDTQLVTVTVTGSNDAPVLSFVSGNEAGAVQEDSTLSVSGQFSSADIDHDATATWSIAGTSTGSYGSITVDSSGQWTYTLANGSDGVASAVQSLKAGESHDEVFSVQVSDGLGGVDTQLVTVTVSGSNDAPMLSFVSGNEAGNVQEDTTLSVSGQFSSADIDHDATATWSINGSPTGSYGSIAVDSSGQWTYTLANGSDGIASAVQSLKAGESHDEVFSVQVSDGLGGVDTQLVTVTVTGSNDAPVLSFATGNDAGNVQEDTSLSISGQFNSADIDHDATASWSIAGSNTGTYGSIAVDSSGQWTYTLANGSDGVASAVQSLKAGESHDEVFSVQVSDGLGGVDTQLVTVTVSGSNDAPMLSFVSGNEAGNVQEDTTLSVSGQFSSADIDHDATATWSINGSATGSYGSIAVDSSGQWTYTLANGSDGVASAVQSLKAGESHDEVFSVQVSDGLGGVDTQLVTVTVSGSNDAPVLSFATGNDVGAVQEDSTLSVSGQFSSTDIDHDATATWSIAGSNTGSYGSITVDSSGQWTYTLANGSDGVASAVQSLKAGESHNEVFSVQVSDGLGGVDTQLVTVTVTGSNDAPVLSFAAGNDAGAVQEDSTLSVSGQFSSADIDHDATASWSIAGSNTGTYGSIAVDSSGQWTYTLANGSDGVASAVQSLKAGESHDEVFSVQVSDGLGGVDTQLVTVTVSGSNDAPMLSFVSGNEAGNVQEDTTLSVSGQFSSADIDHDATATWSINGSATGSYGSIAVDSSGQWTYTLANGSDGVASAVQSLKAGESHDEVFSVQVSDGLGGVDTQLVTVTVSGSNDAPVLSFATGNDVGAVQEDTTLSVSGQFSSADIDHDATASWTINGSPTGTYGSIAVDISGQWTYTLANGTDGVASAVQSLKAGESHDEVFTIQVSDGLGGVDTQLVTVTVTGSNDQPTLTIADTTGAMNEGDGTATLSDSGALSFADVDNTNAVTVSQTANNDIAWSGGTLNLGVASALVAGFSVDQDSWNYSTSQNLDFLGAGETITFSYTVVATDDSGAANAASATQTVTITLTGTNDQPTLTIADSTGAMNEGDGAVMLSDSGVLSFADLDSTDVVTVSHTANGDITWSGGTLNAGVASALAAGFSVDQDSWDYSSSQNLDFLGAGETITFSYTVVATDDSGAANAASATQTVTITITGSNDAPVLSFATGNDAGNVQEDTTLSVSGQFSSADIDHAATASWSINGSPTGTYGSIAVDSAGQWTYTLANGTDGVASAVQSLKAGESHDEVFSVQVSDGLGGVDTQLVTVTVTGSNDAPVLSFVSGNDVGAVQEDSTLSVSGQFSSTDIDHDATATWSIAGSNTGSYGSITVDSTGQWTYTLANGSDGIASAVQSLKAGESHDEVFSVQVSDGLGGVDTQLVTVTVTGSNDAPVLSFVSGNDVGAVQEDSTLSVSGQFSSTDIDHDATATWSIAGSNTGSYGSITVDSTGQWTYTLANGSDGIASAVQSLKAGESHDEVFSVQVSDGLGGVDTQLVTVTVTGSNDAPVLSFATGNDVGAVQEDTSLSVSGQFSSTDIDHDATATWSIAGSNTGSYGSIAVDSSGQWTYTLANGSDGIASAVQSLKAGESHDEVFSVQVSDGLGGMDTQLVTITVTGSNDAPVLSFATGNDVGAVQEDSTLSVSGQFSSADIDHDATASWSINGSPTGTYGSIAVDSSGQWTYTLANGTDGIASAVQSLKAGESHDEVFSVQVSDGLGGVDTQLVTVTVTGSNDAPVLSFASGNDVGAVQEDSTLSVSGQFSSADIDHAATASWSIAGSNTGSYGSIAVDSSGQWTYTLANGSDGIASAVQSLKAGESHDEVFSVQVSDGLGGVDTQLVTVTVSGSNDAPVLSFTSGNDVGAVQEDTSLSVSGQFSSADIDHDATASWSINGSPTGTYGSIAVDSSGQWTYTLANGSDGIASAVQSLKAGESHDEVFSVQVSDGLGGVDTQLVTVTVSGSNDAPVLSFAAGNDAGAVQEDSTLSVSGQFSSADIDHDATATWTINGSPTGTYGSITVDSSGQWTYTLANGSDGIASAVQSLKAGESHDEVFSVQVSDGLGGVDTQLVTVTVSGSNDAPVLSFVSGNDVGAVQEDTTLSVSGQFSSADIDHDATASWSINGSPTGSYGSIAVDGSGQWTYTLANGTDGIASAVQSLKAGESHDEVFSVQVSDGLGGVDTQLVTVTVTGSNDAAVLSSASVTLTETNAPLTTGGSLTVSDIDSPESFQAQSGTTNANGIFAIDTTGNWSYTANSAFDALNVGDSLTDTFAVLSADGTETSVSVTINGTNDAPVTDLNGGGAGNDATAAFTEQTSVLIAPSATITDIDSANLTSMTATLTVRPDGNATESLSLNASATTAAAGLTVSYTTGTGVLSITGSATKATYQTILDGILYNNSSDTPTTSDRTVNVLVSDGIDSSISHSVTIGITALNDTPVNTLPASYTTNEDTAFKLSGLSVADVDAGTGSISVTLTVGSGALTAATAGSVTVSGSGTGSIVLTGTLANINTYLATVANQPTYTPATNANGTVTLTMLTNDGGNTGTGGALSDSDTININITALNDTPVNALPASYTTNEDTAFKLSGLSVADVDAGTGSISVTLTVGSGALTAATAGSVTVSGSGTNSIVLTGTLANINTYLATVANQPTYTPVANANGTVTLTMLTNDGGNTGTGGALSDSDTININITALNDTPVNTLPASYTTNEDTAFKLSGLSVADVDAGAGSISVTLTVGSGSLTAATAGSVTVSGSGTGSIVLTGTLANINTYLATVANQPTYTPVANANGTVTLTMLTNDGGNTGTGGALSDSDTININITALNDTPVNTLPASYTTNEDTAFKLSGLSVADVDAGTGSISVTLTVGSGALTAATAGSVTVSGSGTGSIVLTGTLANINTYLATVANQPTYTPVANANGTVTLTMLTNDGGNTGTGGALSDSDTININITAVNDAPVLSGTVPTSVNVSSGVLVSSFLSSTDVDSGALKGIAITAATRTNGSNGKWQYSTDSGSTWTDVGTVSTSSALLLRSGDLVRMTGNGNAGDLTYKAWDQTSGTFATKVDPGSGGGTSAFSTTNVIWSVTHPAGIAGEPINLALANPLADHSLPVTVTITGVPADWIVNGATHLGDGSWSVTTIDPSVLTVTTTASYVGAMVLLVTETWTNTDGTTGSAIVSNNVEAYAPGSPIFALSLNDNLTGSSGADTFVFAQPIGNNQIYNFDAAADKIDLIGFTGVTGFADLSITNDANGNALVSISSGQTVTLKGVDAADLSEANFQFDVDPLTNNAGTLTIADGAIMPFGGSIHNSGTIELGSAGSTTSLEILFRGATLSGGGQVLLSDNSQNVIFGGSADTVLTNIDNRISGAGQLGAGQMVLINAGLIMASGLNSLVLDTGTHTITNSGVLESTGPGGMTVASTVENTGHLWANGGDLRLLADVTGDGSATIDGDATLTFSGAAHGSVAFHGEGAGTLVIAQAETAGSLVGILGLESNDLLMFGDLAFGANTQLSYNANASGAGGLLTVDDGAHRAEVNLLGHYTVEDFQVTDDGQAGTQVSYHGESSGTLVGSMLADTISGGDGNDIIVGRGGEDTLSGGAGADVFAYLNVNEGGDHILDYNFAEGDTIDLSALLKANFVSGTSQVSDFVQVVQTGSDLTVKVDTDGANNGKNFVDVAVLDHTGTPGPDLVRTWFGDADHTLTA